MAVFRVERNKGYTVMSNHHLRNKELTLKAKGLLSQMLSLVNPEMPTLTAGWCTSMRATSTADMLHGATAGASSAAARVTPIPTPANTIASSPATNPKT